MTLETGSQEGQRPPGFRLLASLALGEASRHGVRTLKEPCAESHLDRKLLARCDSEHLGGESFGESSSPGWVLQLRPQAS